MAGCLPCLPSGRPERLPPDAKVLISCAVRLTSSRRPRESVPRFAWVLADAVALFEGEPLEGSAPRPREAIQLREVSSVRLHDTGSACLRLDTSDSHWWILRALDDHSELPASLGEVVRERLERFRRFRKSVTGVGPGRRSTRISRMSTRFAGGGSSASGSSKYGRRITLRNAEKSSERLVDETVRKQSLLKRIASALPCSTGGDFADRVGGSRTPLRGSCAAQTSNVNSALLARVTDKDLDEAEGVPWTEEAVKFLLGAQAVPEDLAADLRHTVRRGVPDGLKRVLWPLGAGAAETFVEGRCSQVHERLLARAFGDAVPETFSGAVPLFSQGIEGVEGEPELHDVIPHWALLTDQGQSALRRCLWCITLLHSNVEYCPMLPNLLTVLLVFFEESEAMVILEKVLSVALADQTDSSNPVMVLTTDELNRQAKMLLAEARKPHGSREVIVHLEELGLDVPALLIRLLQDGLAAALPFRALCRVYGAFLFEGSVALLHYALAVLKLTAPEVLKSKTSEEAFAALTRLRTWLGSDPQEVDRLTKTAFAAALGGAFRKRASATLSTSFLARKLDLNHVFCRPRLFEPRGACPDDLWQAIWPWVPEVCRVFDPHLVYTPGTDGRAIRTVLAKCEPHSSEPMIFFVYSAAGDIVGGFSPVPWLRSSSYVDCSKLTSSTSPGSSFVFRRLSGGGKPEVFPWTSQNDQLLLASEQHGLHFGCDGVAVSVDRDLVRASTHASASFSCPSLLPQETGRTDGVSFEMARFEVFVLK